MSDFRALPRKLGAAATAFVLACVFSASGAAAQTAPRSALPDQRLDAPVPPPPAAPPAAAVRRAPQGGPAPAPVVDIRLDLREVIITPADAPLAAVPGVAEAVEAAVAGAARRPLDLPALEALRRRMTEALVAEGYVSSGFRLREVNLDEGTVTFRLVEGRIAEILVGGEGIAAGPERPIGALGADYVRARLAPSDDAFDRPFDIDETQEALRILLRDRTIERVDAAIRPGAAPGEAVLDLDVAPRRPYDLAFTFANDTPAGIGELTGRAVGSARNLFLSGDELRAEVELSEGRRRAILEGDAPLWPGGPSPFFVAEAARSIFVDGALQDIDARSDFLRAGFGLRVPLVETSRRRLTTVLAFDWKRTESSVLGEPTSFSPGPIDGVAKTSVLSFSQEFVDLGDDRTLAIRATANLGLPILGATPDRDDPTDGSDNPDGVFWSLIAQAQAAQRLAPELTLIARVQGQYASEGLLPVEQVAIGGRETVRGFGEASAAGDDALVGSLEARIAAFDLAIPDLTPGDHDATLTIAPFIDAGHVRRRGGGGDTLVGAGAGLIWSPAPGIGARLFLAAPLTGGRGDRGLQGEGVHFAMTFALP